MTVTISDRWEPDPTPIEDVLPPAHVFVSGEVKRVVGIGPRENPAEEEVTGLVLTWSDLDEPGRRGVIVADIGQKIPKARRVVHLPERLQHNLDRAMGMTPDA